MEFRIEGYRRIVIPSGVESLESMKTQLGQAMVIRSFELKECVFFFNLSFKQILKDLNTCQILSKNFLKIIQVFPNGSLYMIL